MGFLFMVVFGAILGWLTTIILRIEQPRAILLYIAAAVAGALLAGLFIAPLFGSASLLGDNYSVWTLLLSLAGSLLAVAAFTVVWRKQVR